MSHLGPAGRYRGSELVHDMCAVVNYLWSDGTEVIKPEIMLFEIAVPE